MAYGQTLLGRALADTLKDMEQRGDMQEEESDALFEIFDEVMREEFVAAEPSLGITMRAKSAQGSPTPVAPPTPLFTHQSLDVRGTVRSFNRYMESWNLHAAVEQGGVRLDGVPVDLAHLPSPTEMLVKLHAPQATQKRRR